MKLVDSKDSTHRPQLVVGCAIALAVLINMPVGRVAAGCDPGRTAATAAQTWGSEYNGESIGGLTEPKFERIVADVDNQIPFVEAGASEARIQMTVSVEGGQRIGNGWAFRIHVHVGSRLRVMTPSPALDGTMARRLVNSLRAT